MPLVRCLYFTSLYIENLSVCILCNKANVLSLVQRLEKLPRIHSQWARFVDCDPTSLCGLAEYHCVRTINFNKTLLCKLMFLYFVQSTTRHFRSEIASSVTE